MKEKILFYPLNQKRHSLYNSIIKLLSERYELIYSPTKIENNSKTNSRFKSKLFRKLYYKYIFPVFSISDIKNIFKNNNAETLPNADLIYSSNKIPPGKTPYIIDIENISALNGYAYNKLDKKKIKKELEDSRCRKIVCWNNGARESIINTVKSEKILRKIMVIPFSVESYKIKKNFNINAKLLFVSSINNPDDFETKGGDIAIECFKILKKKYKNISLNIRAKVSNKTVKKYESLNGINFIRENLSEKDMKNLFLESDLLIEPLPGLNLMLDCFNFKVPIVCFDFWFMKEMIQDGKNGILIKSDEYFDKKNYERYLENIRINFIRLTEKKVIAEFASEFAKKSEKIIEDIKLREKLANNSKKLLSKRGPYSMKIRDAKLIKLFKYCLRKNI